MKSTPIAISPDGNWHLRQDQGSHRQDLKGVATGACMQTLEGHSGRDQSDRRHLAQWRLARVRVTDDGAIMIWDVVTGACTQTLNGHGGGVNEIAISPNGAWLASRSDYHYDLGRGDRRLHGRRLMVIAEGHRDRHLAQWQLAPASGSCNSSIGFNNTVEDSGDMATGGCMRTLVSPGYSVGSIAISANGNWLASGSDDGIVTIWDVATGACAQSLRVPGYWIDSVAISPNSKWLASGSDDNAVRIWDVATGACTQSFEGHNEEVNSIAISPSGD